MPGEDLASRLVRATRSYVSIRDSAELERDDPARFRTIVMIHAAPPEGGEPLLAHRRAEHFVLSTIYDELLALQQEITHAVPVQTEVTIYPELGLGGVELLVHREHTPSDQRQALFIFLAFAYVDDRGPICGFELWPASVGGEWPRLHSGEIAPYDVSANPPEAFRVQQFVRNRFIAASRAWNRHSR